MFQIFAYLHWISGKTGNICIHSACTRHFPTLQNTGVCSSRSRVARGVIHIFAEKDRGLRLFHIFCGKVFHTIHSVFCLLSYPQKMWTTFPHGHNAIVTTLSYPQKMWTTFPHGHNAIWTTFRRYPQTLWKSRSGFPQRPACQQKSENRKSYPHFLWITYPHFPQCTGRISCISEDPAGHLTFPHFLWITYPHFPQSMMIKYRP